MGFDNDSLLLALIAPLVITSSSVYAWHSNLAISDQQAAQLYQTNPNDPQIVSWKNALQNKIDLISGTCLTGPSSSFVVTDVCNNIVRVVYDNCLHHPGALLGCLDPRIAQMAKTASNNTAADITERNTVQNNSSQGTNSSICPPGYHRSENGGCEKIP